MKIRQFLQVALLALLAGGVGPAYSAYWQWSKIPANNAGADPSINFAEGQSPSSVNDSARALMARAAEWRDDISGERTSSGTSTAYVITTNQSLGGNGLPATPSTGTMLSFVAHATNGIAATLRVDGGGVFALQSAAGTPAPAGTVVFGTPYRVSFNASNSAWVLEGGYGNPYSIPLGGLLNSTVATPPNSNFILPAGQCISTTTYATYWAAIGSPASGACPGGQFAVIDVRGRNQVALDNLNGTPAGRLTAGGNGCSTSMTVMGASCLNGTESKTLTVAQLPAGITSSGSNLITVASTISTILNGGVSDNYTSVAGTGTFNNPSRSQITSTGNNTVNVTSNNTLGQTFPTVDPNVAVYVFLRVL